MIIKAEKKFLFELIHSMTKGEYERFKLRDLKSGQSKYLQIFEAIWRQKKFDEDKLLKENENNPAFQSYRRMKHYIYRKILQAMVDVDSENLNGTLEALAMLRLLYHRGLNHHFGMILPEAIEKAEKEEEEGEIREAAR